MTELQGVIPLVDDDSNYDAQLQLPDLLIQFLASFKDDKSDESVYTISSSNTLSSSPGASATSSSDFLAQISTLPKRKYVKSGKYSKKTQEQKKTQVLKKPEAPRLKQPLVLVASDKRKRGRPPKVAPPSPTRQEIVENQRRFELMSNAIRLIPASTSATADPTVESVDLTLEEAAGGSQSRTCEPPVHVETADETNQTHSEFTTSDDRRTSSANFAAPQTSSDASREMTVGAFLQLQVLGKTTTTTKKRTGRRTRFELPASSSAFAPQRTLGDLALDSLIHDADPTLCLSSLPRKRQGRPPILTKQIQEANALLNSSSRVDATPVETTTDDEEVQVVFDSHSTSILDQPRTSTSNKPQQISVDQTAADDVRTVVADAEPIKPLDLSTVLNGFEVSTKPADKSIVANITNVVPLDLGNLIGSVDVDNLQVRNEFSPASTSPRLPPWITSRPPVHGSRLRPQTEDRDDSIRVLEIPKQRNQLNATRATARNEATRRSAALNSSFQWESEVNATVASILKSIGMKTAKSGDPTRDTNVVVRTKTPKSIEKTAKKTKLPDPAKSAKNLDWLSSSFVRTFEADNHVDLDYQLLPSIRAQVVKPPRPVKVIEYKSRRKNPVRTKFVPVVRGQKPKSKPHGKSKRTTTSADEISASLQTSSREPIVDYTSLQQGRQTRFDILDATPLQRSRSEPPPFAYSKRRKDETRRDNRRLPARYQSMPMELNVDAADYVVQLIPRLNKPRPLGRPRKRKGRGGRPRKRQDPDSHRRARSECPSLRTFEISPTSTLDHQRRAASEPFESTEFAPRVSSSAFETPKRKRGRPRKSEVEAAHFPFGRPSTSSQDDEKSEDRISKRRGSTLTPNYVEIDVDEPPSIVLVDKAEKRKRGRPRKVVPIDAEPRIKRRRGRPPKNGKEVVITVRSNGSIANADALNRIFRASTGRPAPDAAQSVEVELSDQPETSAELNSSAEHENPSIRLISQVPTHPIELVDLTEDDD